MCDTMCAIGERRSLFGKNSDRPIDELQLVEAHPRRPAGSKLATTYLEIPDEGAAAVVASRPEWMWGFEHGVNEHGVAIGNEEIWTVDDPRSAPEGLLGMDLVRLGLERGTSADGALEVMVSLLETYGQGGVGNRADDEPYFSSFLIVDATSGWVLETSGRTWVARPVISGDAISNRISIRTEWTRASSNIEPGTDFDSWRHPQMWTGHADRRLAVSRKAVVERAALLTERDLVAVLRSHVEGPWGAPGDDSSAPQALPPHPFDPDSGEGFTICAHLRDYQATAASMVASLPSADEPVRTWVAIGSPCTSIFVPAFVPGPLPRELGRHETASRFSRLARAVENDGSLLGEIRATLAPVETELWEEADAIVGSPDRWADFAETAGHRVSAALSSAEGAVLGSTGDT